jgi:hypothetical protein
VVPGFENPSINFRENFDMLEPFMHKLEILVDT